MLIAGKILLTLIVSVVAGAWFGAVGAQGLVLMNPEKFGGGEMKWGHLLKYEVVVCASAILYSSLLRLIWFGGLNL